MRTGPACGRLRDGPAPLADTITGTDAAITTTTDPRVRALNRAALISVLVGTASVAAGPGTAWAWRAGGTAWPGRVITYVDATGHHGYHRAVREAARAWNRARVGVRFRATSRAHAEVVLVFSRRRCLSGRAGDAPDGWRARRVRVVMRACPPVVRALAVAHELGHVLGLAHDDRRCALMNRFGVSDGVSFALPGRCSRWAPPAWAPNLVGPDDRSGARALYAAPKGPSHVILVPGLRPEVRWREPVLERGSRVVVVRTAGRCPTELDVAAGSVPRVYRRRARPGSHQVVDRAFPAVAGRYCYGVFTLNRHGRATRRPGRASFVFHASGPVTEVRGPAATGTPVG